MNSTEVWSPWIALLLTRHVLSSPGLPLHARACDAPRANHEALLGKTRTILLCTKKVIGQASREGK